MPVLALALYGLLLLALCEAVWISWGVLLEDAHSQVCIRLAPLLWYAGQRLKLHKSLRNMYITHTAGDVDRQQIADISTCNATACICCCAQQLRH
jgi:hypothetical protein